MRLHPFIWASIVSLLLWIPIIYAARRVALALISD